MTTISKVKEQGLNLSTLVSALAATCCLFPITLSALGVSAGFLGAYSEFIEQYEIYAFIVAFLFLGLGFYTAYFQGQAGRVGKVILWLSLALVLIATGYEVYEHWFAAEEAGTVIRSMLA